MSDMMLITIIGSASVGLVLLFLVYKYKYADAMDSSSIFTVKKKHVRKNNYDNLYHNLENMFGVKGYTRRIRSIFEVYFPGDERLVKELTVKIVIGMFTLLALSLIIVLLLRPTIIPSAPTGTISPPPPSR